MGLDVVSVPDGEWEEHLVDIHICDFECVKGTVEYEESLESRIDDPESHVGSNDVWFHYPRAGFSGHWEPPNRNGHSRFAMWFVRPDRRGEGIGKALAIKWFYYALNRPDIEEMDTYTYVPKLFYDLGFEWVRQYDGGTHYMTYTKS